MTSQHTLSTAGRIYLGAVIAAGLVVVMHSVQTLYIDSVGLEWFVLAGLTLLSGSFTVKIPSIPARLSVSETFVFAAVILFGPAAATMIVALDSLVISFWLDPNLKRGLRILFNLSAPAFSIWIAGKVFFAIAGVPPLSQAPQPLLSLLLPLFLLAVVYFLLNSWLIAIAVGIERSLAVVDVWRRNFMWLSLNYFSGASVAVLLLPYLQVQHYAFLRIIGLLLPLLLISYLTIKTALGRVDDANRHLTELNHLYLSTIETLAMAIDAKDQITHGHIRRVQIYAVGLAKAMGLAEDAQIKAVEAAALLHDMGKLAVPEYILNKPGPLTAAEFEKMKLHASVGADILSAIDFPYPVVPIVRHHHECWNGTGYPDGLKGTDIPIGARILSVVDCFDALTSDRPYRPRLADSEALTILAERRGTMYDPLIVDTFARVYKEIAPPEESTSTSNALAAITYGGQVGPVQAPSTSSRFNEISSSTEETLLLYEMARSLTGRLSLGEAADMITKHLRRVVPATTCVFFVYDESSDDLYAAHASGENAAHFAGVRVPMGQRLTGWVAANRQTILNSDPTLDLGEVARSLRPPLNSCLSTPLMTPTTLVGTLTVYSPHRQAFNDEHRRVLEVIAKQVSQTILQAAAQHRESPDRLRDESTGLPSRLHCERFLSSELSTPSGLPCSLLLLTLHGFVGTRDGISRIPSDQILAHATDHLRRVLRAGDLLFRFDSERLAIVLTKTDSATAEIIAERVNTLNVPARREDGVFSVGVRIGIATAPRDGLTLSELMVAAENRPWNISGRARPSIH